MSYITKYIAFCKEKQIEIKSITQAELTALCTNYLHYALSLKSHYYYYHSSPYTAYFEPWSETYKTALKTRKLERKYMPNFTRYLAKRFKRLDPNVWRKPKGLHNKKRKKIATKGATPTIGYGLIKAVRGANAKGYFEQLCYNHTDISVCAKDKMIRLARPLGFKKRLMLEDYARSINKYIVNPINWSYYETR